MSRQVHEPCGKDMSYFEGMPDGLAELADLMLSIQVSDLPVHSYLLKDSLILLAAAAIARQGDQRVPLPGESRIFC